MRHRKALIAAAVVALSSRAAADPVVHLKTPSTVQTDGGSQLRLPPGYFLDEDTYRLRDNELRHFQEQETRLKAENKSLRESVIDVNYKTIACAVGFGIIAGVVVVHMIE